MRWGNSAGVLISKKEEGDKERGDGPGELDRVARVEVLKKKEKGVLAMEDIIYKPETEVRSIVF